MTPSEISAAEDQTSAKFNITLSRDAAWTAVSDNGEFTLSPESGNASQEVTVSFAANTSTSAKTAVITVNVEGKDTPFTVTITQAATSKQPVSVGKLTEWNIPVMCNGADETISTWDSPDQGTGAGTNGQDVSASTGIGKIEYYSRNKSGYTLYANSGEDEKGYCMRKSGGTYNRLMVYCPAPGDYWSFTAEAPEGKIIPAGTTVKFHTPIGGANATSEQWMPLFAVQTVTETIIGLYYNTKDKQTRTNTVQANWTMTAKNNSICQGEFTVVNATTVLKVRMSPVGKKGIGGKHINDSVLGASTMTAVGHQNNEEGD